MAKDNKAKAEAKEAAPAETAILGGELRAAPEGATESPVELQKNAAASEAEGAAAGAGDVEPEDTPEGKAKDSGKLNIARKNASGWHCPFCDHSMTHSLLTCPKCGAVRKEGTDEVTRKKVKDDS